MHIMPHHCLDFRCYKIPKNELIDKDRIHIFINE